jgi:hypothetical protein
MVSVATSLLIAPVSLGKVAEKIPRREQEAPRIERPLSLDNLGSDVEPDASPVAVEKPWASPAGNLRFTVDLSSRISIPTRRGKVGTEHVIGLDLHKVFSDAEGDWGTLRLQPYL